MHLTRNLLAFAALLGVLRAELTAASESLPDSFHLPPLLDAHNLSHKHHKRLAEHMRAELAGRDDGDHIQRRQSRPSDAGGNQTFVTYAKMGMQSNARPSWVQGTAMSAILEVSCTTLYA